LSDNGSVYSIGVNRFGQLGESNLNISLSGKPIKLEFSENVKIKSIKVGDNHNLMLGDDGQLYGNGDNSSGQLDGDLDNFLYYKCTPVRIPIPDESKIIKFYAKNNRSAALLENGKFYYWGGYSYNNGYLLNSQPKFEGFNLFNNEIGIPENCKILDVGIGYLHDLLLID
jgi:alpha-tubulin suppressor-like RCC1 family protein